MSTEEYTETIELSDQDQEDIAKLYALPTAEEEVPVQHTILEVWREVLAPAQKLAGEKVTPQYASKMVATYPGLTLADCREVQARYYAKIGQLAEILDLEISSDPDCLSYLDAPEEDAAENAYHYKGLLITWQQLFLQWELEWTCTDPDAAAELAAISEVHKLFFGPTGLTQHLDNIRLEYTEDDAATLAEVLQEQREAYTEAVSGE
jgi:hypothetical protein